MTTQLILPRVMSRGKKYFIEQARIQSEDKQAYDHFGESVSISDDGNTAIVGAPQEDTGGTDAGAAYIFTRNDNIWTQEAKIQSSPIQQYASFGESVSISGDGNTAIVGSWRSAFVFTRSGSTWTQQSTLIADPQREDNDAFGCSVSISNDGNTAIVGAYLFSAGGYGAGGGYYASGAAFIFTRSGSNWTQQAEIRASDKEEIDFFGYSVSISGDKNTAIAGAPQEDTGGSNAGSAYIFTRSGSTWTEQAKIQASDKQGDDNFGWSVSISGNGNTAIVGTPYEDTGGSNAGSAYIFTRSGSTWTEQAKIQASGREAEKRFGRYVSISEDGNTIIVGAKSAAYIFTRSGSTWSQRSKILSTVTVLFGYSVSISANGNTAIVGAHGEGSLTGAAYIFIKKPDL